MSAALQWLAALYLIVWTILGIALIVGAFLAWRNAAKSVRRFTKRLEPTMDHIEKMTSSLDEAVKTVTDKAKTIADTTEKTTREVSDRVRTTTGALQETILTPAIGFASTLAGLKRAIEAWRDAASRRRSAASRESDDS